MRIRALRAHIEGTQGALALGRWRAQTQCGWQEGRFIDEPIGSKAADEHLGRFLDQLLTVIGVVMALVATLGGDFLGKGGVWAVLAESAFGASLLATLIARWLLVRKATAEITLDRARVAAERGKQGAEDWKTRTADEWWAASDALKGLNVAVPAALLSFLAGGVLLIVYMANRL